MSFRVSWLRLEILACSLVLMFASTGCGGGGGTVTSPGPSSSPQIGILTPTSVLVGVGQTTIIVQGSGFLASSVVQWNGTALATTYVSAEQLNAMVPANLLAAAGTAQISVSNGGGTSAAVTFTINDPSPTLASISPTSVIAGSGAITLRVTGNPAPAPFVAASVVTWNNTPLATTLVNTSTLDATVPAALLGSANSAQIAVSNPAPGGGTSISQVFYVYSNATTTGFVNAIPADLAWDATHRLIYASVPDIPYGGGPYSGNLISIDPTTANIVGQQAAGSSPDQIGLSPDDSFLWLGEDDTGAIQRFSLPDMTPGTQIANPAGSKPNPAESLQVAPDNPNTLAVIYNGFWSDAGVVIYDGTAPRPISAPSYSEVGSAQWGANSTVLYGAGTVGEPDLNWTYTVNSTGIADALDVGFSFLPSSGEIHYDPKTSLLYTDEGQVFDPVANVLVGQFDLSQFYTDTLCVVDSDQGVVFFLGELLQGPYDGEVGIEAFDQKTYALLRTIAVPDAAASPGLISSFLRWGNAGLAFGVLHPDYQTTGFEGLCMVLHVLQNGVRQFDLAPLPFFA